MSGYSINVSNSGTEFDDVQDIFENLVRALRDISESGSLDVGTLVVTDDAGVTVFHDAKDVQDVTEALDTDTDETLDPANEDTDPAPDPAP